MSEKEIMNETMEGSYAISEVGSSRSTMIKIAGAGILVAVVVGGVMYFRNKKKANQMIEVEEIHTKNSNKSEK